MNLSTLSAHPNKTFSKALDSIYLSSNVPTPGLVTEVCSEAAAILMGFTRRDNAVILIYECVSYFTTVPFKLFPPVCSSLSLQNFLLLLFFFLQSWKQSGGGRNRSSSLRSLGNRLLHLKPMCELSSDVCYEFPFIPTVNVLVSKENHDCHTNTDNSACNKDIHKSTRILKPLRGKVIMSWNGSCQWWNTLRSKWTVSSWNRCARSRKKEGSEQLCKNEQGRNCER